MDEKMAQLKTIPTCELVEELAHREGVAEVCVDTYVPFSISVEGVKQSFAKYFDVEVDGGPARILVIID